jgi:multiple sugar transport system substrate-binding protein
MQHGTILKCNVIRLHHVIVINHITIPSIAILCLALIIALTCSSAYASSSQHAANAVESDKNKKAVTLTATLVEPKPRWDMLLKSAVQKLQERHPDMNIKVNYTVLPYDVSRTTMLNLLANQSPIDLISLDQIWLGNFAERGYLTDLTNRALSWGRLSDWYEGNLDGNLYKGKVYAIWAWTDVRGIWYWKDLLNKAQVDPNSLRTWNGYIASAKKLDAALKASDNIQGIGLDCGASMWYPYLWMQGGEIIKMRSGHPTKGSYWFPDFNSSAGIRAMQFIKDQIDAGLKPIANGNFDTISFINRTYAVFLGGSWLPGEFPSNETSSITQRVGFIPAYPVPREGVQTTTVMGGWELGIPQTSKNKDIAWELITLMLEPDVLAPVLEKTGYLPTQTSIGQGIFSQTLERSIPYYDKMLSMVQIGRGRPNIPEFAQIDDFVTEAGKQVCTGLKEPKQALDDAAGKSAKVLGW